MSAREGVLYGITGEYVWTRKRVWFWQVDTYFANGWSQDYTTGLFRPVMVYRHRRPNGAQPFDVVSNPAPRAPLPAPAAIRGATHAN